MPQKHWDSGRDGKHLGWDDISAMSIQELLEHLKKWYGVTDLQPTLDVAPLDRPPWTTPGDPVIHNALECWNDSADNWGGQLTVDSNSCMHLSLFIKRKDVIQLLTNTADDGGTAGF